MVHPIDVQLNDNLFSSMHPELRYAWDEVNGFLLAFVYKLGIDLRCLYVSVPK